MILVLTRLASRCPEMTLVVSKAIFGRDPINPKMVVRTASWTRGSDSAVNLAIKSDGLILETTCIYGFLASRLGAGPFPLSSSPLVPPKRAEDVAFPPTGELEDIRDDEDACIESAPAGASPSPLLRAASSSSKVELSP